MDEGLDNSRRDWLRAMSGLGVGTALGWQTAAHARARATPCVAGVTLIADLLNGVLDPRIRYD